MKLYYDYNFEYIVKCVEEKVVAKLLQLKFCDNSVITDIEPSTYIIC